MRTRSAATYLNDYTARIARMTRDGMRAAAVEGRPSGPLPLGYVRNRVAGEWTVEPEPETAALVEEAFRLVGGGMSLQPALREMTDKGLAGRQGRPMSLSAFHEMLRNPFYIGRVRFNGDTYPGSHQPLVSKTLFAKVQSRLYSRLCR